MATSRYLSRGMKLVSSSGRVAKNGDVSPITLSAIKYRLMTKKDEKEVRQLCYHFWENEPVARAVGIEVPRECELGVDYLLQVACKSQVSVVAEDINNKKLAGVGIFRILTRGDLHMWSYPEDDPNCQKMAKLEKIYAQTSLGPDMCTALNVDRMMHGLATSVLPEYQRKRVGFKIIQFAMNIFNRPTLDIQMVITECTSDQSRKIAENLGFQKVKEVCFIDEETGNPLKNPDNKTDLVGSLHTLSLSESRKNGRTFSTQ